MQANNWKIINNAAIGRSYGSFGSLEAAMDAAKALHQYGLESLIIDQSRLIVYFREEITGF